MSDQTNLQTKETMNKSMKSMKSFHNNQTVKDKFTTRVKEHQEADEIVQDYGFWEDGKGCAVGCTLEKSNSPHGQYPVELGLPEWLAHLEGHIFETLPVDAARQFPLDFLEAIPLGIPESSFSLLRDRFQIFWLKRQKTQIDLKKYGDVGQLIDTVTELLELAISGNEPESAAWSAAWSAAESATRSATRSAAESTAESTAESAAESAARSAARSAAESESLMKRDWLLAELKSLK